MMLNDLNMLKARVASMMSNSEREFGVLVLATKYGVSRIEMMLILKSLEKSEMVRRNPESDKWRYNN